MNLFITHMDYLEFYPTDLDFIRKMGYDAPERRMTLLQIKSFDDILQDDLLMWPEYDEAEPFVFAKVLHENSAFAKDFINLAASYEKLAKRGNLLAKTRLACMYRFCYDSDLREKGLAYARESAEAGHCQAQYIYGLIKSDPTWLQKASDAGFKAATDTLGFWYYNGMNGLYKSRTKALELWRKANGYASAFHLLSDSLEEANTIDVESLVSHKVFSGRRYYRGFNVLIGVLYENRKNYSEAFRWYKRAVESGYYMCCKGIAKLCDEGHLDESGSFWRDKYEEYHMAYVKYTVLTDEKYCETSEVKSEVKSEEKSEKTGHDWSTVLILLIGAAAIAMMLF